MKRIVQLLVACFLLVSVQSSFAQTMKVSGIVTDSTGSPLQNSMVMAVRVKDSLLLGFTRSDKQGKFLLTGFQVDTFSLVVAHPKCDDRTYYIFGSKDNYEINIPNVRMTPMSKELQEVVIYANKNPIYYKGDTLVYVADSFKVAEGAVVEDELAVGAEDRNAVGDMVEGVVVRFCVLLERFARALQLGDVEGHAPDTAR